MKNTLGETILTQRSIDQKMQIDFSTFSNELYILTAQQSTSKKIVKIK